MYAYLVVIFNTLDYFNTSIPIKAKMFNIFNQSIKTKKYYLQNEKRNTGMFFKRSEFLEDDSVNVFGILKKYILFYEI